MSPSQPSARARCSIARPSSSAISLRRTHGAFRRARADALLQAQPARGERLAAQVLVAVAEQVEQRPAPPAGRARRARCRASDVRWMRPWMCWKPERAGRRASMATISPSRTTGAVQPLGQRSERPGDGRKLRASCRCRSASRWTTPGVGFPRPEIDSRTSDFRQWPGSRRISARTPAPAASTGGSSSEASIGIANIARRHIEPSGTTPGPVT